MKFYGEVVNIIFRNEGNFFTILEIDHQGDPLTITGTFPQIAKGDNVEVEGEYAETKYGKQVKAESVKISPPSTMGGMLQFLASNLFKGIGEKTALKIVDKFKGETFDIIEKTPHRLSEIRGISLEKAVEIANQYKSIKHMRESLVFLQSKGITSHFSYKIYQSYKENTIKVVQSNPYRLVEDIEGIGFKTADKIAGLLGIEKTSIYRYRAAFLYILKTLVQDEGNTCIAFLKLIQIAVEILNQTKEEVETKFSEILSDLIMENQVKVFYREDEKMIASYLQFSSEKAIATKLSDIEKHHDNLACSVMDEINHFEKVNKISFHSCQKSAIESSLKNGVNIITGGPGTGKTTIIKCILEIFKARDLKVGLVAPTGRAAKRLSESTGEEAKTIHRMLDLDFKNGKGHFLYNENTRLPFDAIICDEVSMTDVYVMKSLLSAVKLGARIILVGDKDQLPSVGAGNVLKDIIESETYAVSNLTYVYRQGDESLITTNAHKINKGEMPILTSTTSDFFHSNIKEGDKILARILKMFETIPTFSGVEKDEIQVIAPMRRSIVGIDNLNEKLQNALNEPRTQKKQLPYKMGFFRVGDKVMQTSNNYQVEWRKRVGNTLEQGMGIFNGDMGKITDINPHNVELEVTFDDGKVVVYSSETIGDLTLSYAITIHKSQGSEFDVVIIPITGGPPSLYSRNMLYTAITRAKKMVVLIGNKFNIKRMVDNNYIEMRDTMLKWFITGELS